MKIKDGFVKRKIGSRYIVVTTGELSKKMNVVIEMNETTSDIWDFASQGLNEEEIACKLAKKYDISLEKSRSDTEKIVNQMREAGVFE